MFMSKAGSEGFHFRRRRFFFPEFAGINLDLVDRVEHPHNVRVGHRDWHDPLCECTATKKKTPREPGQDWFADRSGVHTNLSESKTLSIQRDKSMPEAVSFRT